MDMYKIVKQLKAGSEKAFDIVYFNYVGLVYSFVLKVIKCQTSDIDDIVQNVFIKMFYSIDTLTSPKKFESWLISIANNEAKNFIKRTMKTNVILDNDLLDTVLDINFDKIKEEFSEVLEGFELEIAILVIVHNFKLNDISKEYNISRSYAYRVLRQVKKKLKLYYEIEL